MALRREAFTDRVRGRGPDRRGPAGLTVLPGCGCPEVGASGVRAVLSTVGDAAAGREAGACPGFPSGRALLLGAQPA